MEAQDPVKEFLVLTGSLIGLAIAVYVKLKVRARRQTRGRPKTNLNSLIGRQLQWVQTGYQAGDYELHAGDELVATLRLRSWGFNSFATGESADGCWTFKLAGFPNRNLAISPCGVDTNIALFDYATGRCGGTVEIADGRKLNFVNTAWRVHELQREWGETLVRFVITPGWTVSNMTVEIQPNAAGMPELPWMVMLGRYLIATTGGEPNWRQMLQAGQPENASARTNLPKRPHG